MNFPSKPTSRARASSDDSRWVTRRIRDREEALGRPRPTRGRRDGRGTAAAVGVESVVVREDGVGTATRRAVRVAGGTATTGVGYRTGA